MEGRIDVGTTPKFKLPYPELSDRPNVPQYVRSLAERVETELDRKADSNTVTTELGKVPLAQSDVRRFSSGWVVCDNKATRGGKEVNLAVQSGRQFVGTPAVPGAGNDITLVWTNAGVVVGVDVTFQGVIQLALPSMAELKTNLREAEVGTERAYPDAPDYDGFFDAVRVWDYTYKEDTPGAGVYAGTSHVGFIVEEVFALLDDYNMPDGVVETFEGTPIGFVERDFIAILWQVLKTQKARINDLETRIEALEK